MFSTRDHGGIAVVEETVDRKRIEQELRRLDPSLFLDPEWDYDSDGGRYLVWTVKQHLGSGVPPRLLFEWRDFSSFPAKALPLTFGIIEYLKSLERKGRESAFERADRENEALRAQRARESEDGYREVLGEVLPLMSPVHGGMLHRGVGLRMSRDRQRRRGEKV